MIDKILTTTEVAKLLTLSPNTIRKLFDAGEIGGFRIPNSKHRRIRMIDVFRFIRGNDYPVPERLKNDYGAYSARLNSSNSQP